MRTGSVLAGLLLLGAPLQARAETSLWIQPLGTAFAAANEVFYLPLGANLALDEGRDLVLELTPTRGNWYGCSSRSSGAWVSAGWASFSGDQHAGWFVQPKLIGRFFRTSGAVSAPGWLFPCDGPQVNGSDLELRAGADAGHAWRLGPAAIALAIGASAGFCWNCLGESALLDFWNTTPRRTRVALGINVNLLRLGVAF
jgi:hypothetical protein